MNTQKSVPGWPSSAARRALVALLRSLGTLGVVVAGGLGGELITNGVERSSGIALEFARSCAAQESKPEADAKTDAAKPADSKPADSKPADSKPSADAKPEDAAKPVADRSADSQTKAAPPAALTIDDLMYLDPACITPKFRPVFSPKLKPLWLKALARPEAETKRMAADTFAAAVERGMREFEGVAEPLIALLKDDPDPSVRRAAARALASIDAKEAATVLANRAQSDGLLMAQIAEPALARWGVAAVRDMWLKRLAIRGYERGHVLLAIKSLGETRDAEAVEPLRAILLDDAAAPELRMAAAGAIGNILDSKAVADASDLAGRKLQPAHFGPLLAVKLLVRHRDADAVKLLDQLAKHAEPAVATEALGRLLAIDLALAEPHVAAASTSADAGLRKLAAQTWVRRGTVESIRSLGPLLNDRNPTVRRFVAVNFVEFGWKAELKGAVIEESTKVLAGDQWRGLEQAALVLGSLDHEPAAPRLIALLPNPRAEVAVTVAWALKKLKIPETLPALLAHAKSVDKAIRGMGAPPHLGPQISQIFQTFGDQRYRESEELLRTWVPKSMLDPNARAAACWALGYFHVNEPDCDLVPVFVARLSDVSSPLPEMPAVRQLTAVGLGRMRAASQLEVLRRFAKLDGNKLATGIACGWSIEQLTGEKMKVSGPLEFGVGGWFIEPLDDPESPKPEDFLSAPVPTTPNEPMPDGGPVKGPPPGGAGPGGGRPGGPGGPRPGGPGGPGGRPGAPSK